MEQLVVREARPEDAYALWIWANDLGTRTASNGRPEISWADHYKWFRDRLDDPSHTILLGLTPTDQPIGTIRFDSADEWATARLSYLVAPEARGLGLSAPLVSAGLMQLDRLHAHLNVWADVMLSNPRSLRVFRRLGWREEPQPTNITRFWAK